MTGRYRMSRSDRPPSAELDLTSTDGLRLACARWNGRRPVRGVAQIAHGMGEHVGRYVGLIEAKGSDALLQETYPARGTNLEGVPRRAGEGAPLSTSGMAGTCRA